MQKIIRSKSKPLCICCQSEGATLYGPLKDRLFDVGGDWYIKRCNNQNCGLLWLDPMPVKEDLHLAYTNYYTHNDTAPAKASLLSKLIAGYQATQYGYLKQQTTYLTRLGGRLLGLFRFFRESMDYPFIYFSKQNKGLLLELGCGSGATLKKFKDWGWQVTGLDFDEQAVKNARSKGLSVEHGDIFMQKYPDNCFDAIFSSHVFEHVPDPEALLNESFRILKPNGIFVSVMPNSDSLLHRYFESNWRELDPPRHLHIFNPDSLASIFQRVKFNSLDIKTSNYSATGVWFMSYKISKCGVANMQELSPTRYLGYFIRLYLVLISRFSKLSGEEIIVIAKK